MSTPFDLNSQTAYQRWRDAKRANPLRQAQDLVVDVADPRVLSDVEQQALLQRCATANMAIYRSPVRVEDKNIPRQLAEQLGLHRLDGNWLADEDGVARAEQAGPVFSVDDSSGALHMRYTARTRSVQWKDDATTRAAAAFLEQLLGRDGPHIFRLALEPGMGLVCNNVLHDRAGFVDDPQQPRLLYRARYLDRIRSY